jgi:hypothetical protein
LAAGREVDALSYHPALQDLRPASFIPITSLIAPLSNRLWFITKFNEAIQNPKTLMKIMDK